MLGLKISVICHYYRSFKCKIHTSSSSRGMLAHMSQPLVCINLLVDRTSSDKFLDLLEPSTISQPGAIVIEQVRLLSLSKKSVDKYKCPLFGYMSPVVRRKFWVV